MQALTLRFKDGPIIINDGKRLRASLASLLVERCRNTCGTGGWEGSTGVTKSENDQQRNAA